MERKEIEDRDLKAILTMLDFTEKEITREIFKEYVFKIIVFDAIVLLCILIPVNELHIYLIFSIPILVALQMFFLGDVILRSYREGINNILIVFQEVFDIIDQK